MFYHRIDGKRKNIPSEKNISKKIFFLDSLLNNSDFFCRTKPLFHLMPYFCRIKYVPTAGIKEAR